MLSFVWVVCFVSFSVCMICLIILQSVENAIWKRLALERPGTILGDSHDLVSFLMLRVFDVSFVLCFWFVEPSVAIRRICLCFVGCFKLFLVCLFIWFVRFRMFVQSVENAIWRHIATERPKTIAVWFVRFVVFVLMFYDLSVLSGLSSCFICCFSDVSAVVENAVWQRYATERKSKEKFGSLKDKRKIQINITSRRHCFIRKLRPL